MAPVFLPPQPILQLLLVILLCLVRVAYLIMVIVIHDQRNWEKDGTNIEMLLWSVPYCFPVATLLDQVRPLNHTSDNSTGHSCPFFLFLLLVIC